jgi:hypothetical protein
LHPDPSQKIRRLKLLGLLLTAIGVAVFTYFVYAVGFREIIHGVSRFGVLGFVVILLLYLVRIWARANAWRLSVHEPYVLSIKDTMPAVVIGEAMSSTIPLGILISGTSKALAVRNRIPLVAGLSSVATENLFYSLTTSAFLIIGGVVLLRGFAVDESLVFTINFLMVSVAVLVVLGFIMVIRQWHFASETCEWLYRHGIWTRLLENGRLDVRLFENLIYDFYRRYPRRFLPICLFEALYHLGGIAEVWYILLRLSGEYPSLVSAFLLESVSRLITILFKLVPFVIGVDEAGAQFIGETVAIGAGVGVTLAIIRKGRILFWTAVGMLLIVNRGLSVKEALAERERHLAESKSPPENKHLSQ